MKSQDIVVEWPSARNPRFRFNFCEPGFDDYIHDSFLRKGSFYEIDLLNLLASLSIGEGLVLDVGAYVGNHTIFFSGVMGRSVISVEANPAAFALLCENININNLFSLVKPLCLTASDRSGCRHWTKCLLENNHGATSLVDTPEAAEDRLESEECWIESIRLDELYLDNVSLIKIDVEGMEINVLEGLSQTIESSKPTLALECMTAIDFARVAGWCYDRGYLPISRKAATPVLVFAHSSVYSDVCHGCPPPHWSHFIP